MKHPAKTLTQLLTLVERTAGFTPTSPAEFTKLADAISSRSACGDSVSVSTLKRLWGYVSSPHAPSDAILSVLARFCGYCDFTAFSSTGHPDSGFIVMTPMLSSSLRKGDIIELTWAPDRMTRLQALGGDDFEGIDSINAKLIPGDRLKASVFCIGYPFYATSIRRGPSVIPAYVAGREGGLLSVLLLDSDSQ